MASLWERALALENRELYTVEGKKFTFVASTEKRIDVSPEDGTPGKPIGVYCRDLEIAEENIKDFAIVIPKDLTKAGVSRGPTYIAGIMRALAKSE